MSFCGRFFGNFKDEHASSSGASDAEDAKARADELAGTTSGAPGKRKWYQRRKQAPKKKVAKKVKQQAANTLQLAPYLLPINVQVTTDGNTVHVFLEIIVEYANSRRVREKMNLDSVINTQEHFLVAPDRTHS